VQQLRRFAGHPEPQQCYQESLLSQALLPTSPQNRKLLLADQGLAAHRHPLRETRPKLPCRHSPRRCTLLDQAVSPDPRLPPNCRKARTGESSSMSVHARARSCFTTVPAMRYRSSRSSELRSKRQCTWLCRPSRLHHAAFVTLY